MAKRNGGRSAVMLLHHLCNFLTKYRASIIGATEASVGTKIDAVLTACVALTGALLEFFPDTN
jgi:hypothetical protein